MVICNKCGEDNPMGRVFCLGCGTKLDLKDISHEDLFKVTKLTFREKHGATVAKVLVVALLSPLGLAFWPMQSPISDEADGGAASTLERSLRKARSSVDRGGMVQLAAGGPVLNGLANKRSSQISAQSLSFGVSNSVMSVRAIYRPTWKLGDYKVSPIYSCDVDYTADGKAIRAKTGRMGHLPLIGPAALIAAIPVGKIFSAQDEWPVTEHLDTISIKERTLRVTLKKKKETS